MMKFIKINKIRVKNVTIYQTSFIVSVENWVSPQILLEDIKNNNPDFNIQDCKIIITMDDLNYIHMELEVSNIDGVKLI